MKFTITRFHRAVKSAHLFIGLLLVALFAAGSAMAQTTPVRGTVTAAEDNSPVPGASVTEDGTQNGTVTDSKGNFTLNVTQGSRLNVSFIGYTKQTIAVSGPVLNVRLRSDNRNLNEVVVIGYGTAKRKDIVGSLTTVNTRTAGATTSTDPAQLIIGKAAGVQVLNTDGTPGSNAQIIIRGTGSFTNISPVYVIDGIQSDGNAFNAVAPQDIENITILKDASSTAIYGAAAANGVVIVTTRKGKSGQTRISFTSQYGISNAWKQLDLMNAPQYVALVKDIATTLNTPLPPKFSTDAVSQSVTDWQKQVFRQGVATDNQFNIQGGSEKTTYNFSLGYITQGAIVKNYQNNRINGRFNLDENLGRFHFGQQLIFRHTTSTGTLANLENTIAYPPYQNILDPAVLGGYSIVSNSRDNSDAGNPLQPVYLNYNKNREFVFYPSFFGEVELIKGLKVRSQLAATFGGYQNESYSQHYTMSNDLDNPRSANLGFGNNFSYRFENYLSFNRTFGKHNLNATLGTSYLDAGYSNNLGAKGTGIANDQIQNISVATAQAVTGASSGYGTQVGRELSYYARLIYTFADKYVLSGTIRRDGSSNFGLSNQYGNFPAGGFAWKFGEESFIKEGLPWLSDGKLRVGYGRTGNNNFNLGLTQSLTYSGSPAGNLIYSLGTSEAFNAGVTAVSLASPNLRWETTDQTDGGIDLGFFQNRLTFSADYYDRNSKGLLVNVPVPSSTGIGGVSGYGSNTLVNAANVDNKGLEFALAYQGKSGNDFSYNLGVNFTYNKNEVKALGSQFQAPIQDGFFNQVGPMTYTAKGTPIGSFYGYRVDHVARDQAEIDALNAATSQRTAGKVTSFQDGLKPGDFIFKDITNQGYVSDKSQQVLGSPIPKYQYGFNLGLNYSSFDFNLVISGVAGVSLLNSTKYITEASTTPHNASTQLLNRWEKPGDVALFPRAGQNQNGSANLRPSDFWVENGAYMRVRNLTIGYTVPSTSLNNWTNNVVKRLRIYVAAQNLLTITKYDGYDPEISTQGSNGNYITQRGIDTGQIPQPRTFIGGIQLGF